MSYGEEKKMKGQPKNAKMRYSFAEDILFASPVKREYDSSIQMGDLIFDLDKKNRIIGFEIMNASKVLGVPKLYIYNYKKIKIEIAIKDDVIKINAVLITTFRNAEKRGILNIERIRPEHISESCLEVKAIA